MHFVSKVLVRFNLFMLLFGRLLKPRYRCSCFIPHSPPPLLSLIVHDRTDIVRLFHVGASLPQRLVPDAANDHGVRIYVPDGCGDWSERSEATGYSRHQATRNARRLTQPLRPTTSSCSNKNTWPSVRRLSPLWSLRWPTAIARSNRRRLSSSTPHSVALAASSLPSSMQRLSFPLHHTRMPPSSSSSSNSSSRTGGGSGSVSSHLPSPASSPMLLFGIGQHSVHQLPAGLDPHMPLGQRAHSFGGSSLNAQQAGYPLRLFSHDLLLLWGVSGTSAPSAEHLIPEHFRATSCSPFPVAQLCQNTAAASSLTSPVEFKPSVEDPAPAAAAKRTCALASQR